MDVQGEKYDVVYVTFTKGVNAEDTSVSNAVNWIVDGVKVPTGFLVENDTTGPGNASVGYRRIMLMFPVDTLKAGDKHVLNANQALVSKDGTTLTGENEWVYNVYESSEAALASNENHLGY